MEEQMERIEIPFTYTYDQFTVFFHGDHVFIGEKDFPIGQCCVDIMNLDESVFHEIDQRVRELSRMMAYGIDLALQPHLTVEDIAGLLG